MSGGLFQNLQELNAAGSYDRRHGATINQQLLDSLDTALGVAFGLGGGGLSVVERLTSVDGDLAENSHAWLGTQHTLARKVMCTLMAAARKGLEPTVPVDVDLQP